MVNFYVLGDAMKKLYSFIFSFLMCISASYCKTPQECVEEGKKRKPPVLMCVGSEGNCMTNDEARNINCSYDTDNRWKCQADGTPVCAP